MTIVLKIIVISVVSAYIWVVLFFIWRCFKTWLKVGRVFFTFTDDEINPHP